MAEPQRPTHSTSNTKVLGFTFVDQSDDLRSVADKKIVNQSQRQQIRSHVMKSVRQDEIARGVKRPTGRNINKRRSARPSSNAIPKLKKEDSTSSPSTISSPASSQMQELYAWRRPQSINQHLMDPFNTFPQAGAPGTVDVLLQYCTRP